MPAAGGNAGLCFMTFSLLFQKGVKTERGRLLPQNSEDPLKLAALLTHYSQCAKYL